MSDTQSNYVAYACTCNSTGGSATCWKHNPPPQPIIYFPPVPPHAAGEEPMQGPELGRHLEMLSRTLPGESGTLRETIEAIQDAADKTLNASTEWEADLWWATLRAHSLVLYHDWDGAGNPTPASEPCELCGSYSPAASQAAPVSEMPKGIASIVETCRKTASEDEDASFERATVWLADHLEAAYAKKP